MKNEERLKTLDQCFIVISNLFFFFADILTVYVTLSLYSFGYADNLSFFLEVESIFLCQNTSLPYLIRKLLLVIGDCTARIGIPYEAI